MLLYQESPELMADQSGFQTNTTIHAAFWWYSPDRTVDKTTREAFVEVNSIQYIETTPDHQKVWIYYPTTGISTSQEPRVLEGKVALAFMNDMEALFI
jgi:hypothetical protein